MGCENGDMRNKSIVKITIFSGKKLINNFYQRLKTKIAESNLGYFNIF